MRLLSDTTVEEYARQFLHRERGKINPNNIEALRTIDAACEDPVSWLRCKHDYKLPRPHNDRVSIVRLASRDEVENLLVHEYMPKDSWMVERGLVPEPFTRRLGDLAQVCLERRYFSRCQQDRQIQYFKKWKARATLANVLSIEERPLIESAESDQYEIVDGWGRLLPFAALLIQGMAFEPFEVFLALSAPSRPNLNIEHDALPNHH